MKGAKIGAAALIGILIVISIGVLGYNKYYWDRIAPKRTTVATSYVDNLTYDPNNKYFGELNLFANDLNNGLEVFEIRLNGYTDPAIAPEEEPFKNVYSYGIQFIGKPDFKEVRTREPGTWGFLGLGSNWSRRQTLKSKAMYYNTTGNDKSYTATAQLGIDSDEWIVDFDGTIALIKQKGYDKNNRVIERTATTVDYEYCDILSFAKILYESVKSLPNGYDVLQFDLSKWFKGYMVDETGSKFETTATAHQNWMFMNLKVNRSANGLVDASQSIFNIVDGDANYTADGFTSNDYWSSNTIYNLTETDFDFVPYGETGTHLAKLKPAVINYLKAFNNLDIVVNIDLDSEYLAANGIVLAGFARNAYSYLNVKQTVITSSAPAVFKLYEPLNIQLHNVTIEMLGGAA